MSEGADSRVAAYAELLVDRSIGVRPGWQVLVMTTTEARPLAQELSRLLAERGAWALPRISFGPPAPGDLDWIEAAPAELKAELPPLERELVERIDASIFVLAPEVGRTPSPAANRALGAQLLAYRARGRSREVPSVRCDYPCEEFARRAELSFEEYEDIFYAACLRDWDAERERMRPVLERLDPASTVRILGWETDLTLSLDGRRGEIDDGHLNVPGGEVLWSPVEDSAEGEILFDVALRTARGEIGGVRLRFERGVVTGASAEVGADVLEAVLGTDDGARRLGELGIGLNDGIPRPLRNVLFDEKLDGTIHLALGDGFTHLGGTNRSAVHADLIKDLKPPGSRIECDGEVVFADGRWLV
jgi:aminopeptidase